MESGFLSALGAMFELWKALLVAVVAKGGSEADLGRVIAGDDSLPERIAVCIRATPDDLQTQQCVIRFWKELLAAVVAKGGTKADLELVIGDPALVAKLAWVFTRAARKVAAARAEEEKAEELRRAQLDGRAPLQVEIDYGLSLEAMIAAGRYDSVNDGICKEFSIQGRGRVLRELILVRLGKEISTNEALSELDRRGLRSAKIEELLALGAARPELQEKFPIVAIGSRFDNERSAYYGCDKICPALSLDREKGRSLALFRGGWHDDFRFLAALKDAEPAK